VTIFDQFYSSLTRENAIVYAIEYQIPVTQ